MVYSATRVIEALRGARSPGEPLVPPVSVSAVYRFVEADVPPVMEVKYGRENNPTTMLLERGLAVAEEADWCLAFNSGMAAIAGVLEALASLEGRLRVVSSRLLYGSTRTLLDKMKVLGLLEVRYAGPPWEELLEAVEEEKPNLVVVETIGNPTLRVPPLPRLSRLFRPGMLPLSGFIEARPTTTQNSVSAGCTRMVGRNCGISDTMGYSTVSIIIAGSSLVSRLCSL